MSNKYIEQGTSKRELTKKLKRCSAEKGRVISEALKIIEAREMAAKAAPVVEAAPEPVVEAAPVVEAVEVVAEAPAPKPKAKRSYRRRKTTTTKE